MSNITTPERTYQTVNPATGELVERFDTLTDAAADAALATAHEAFGRWSRTSLEERISIAHKLADAVAANAESLASLITLEMGKPLAQGVMEVQFAAEMFRYYAENGAVLLADEVVDVAGFGSTVIRREPIGVVLGIEPWNGPVFQALRVAAPNLVLGNTVLLKPAEISAKSSLALAEVLAGAGLPDGVFQVVLASTDQVSTYIADDRVRAVTLTGSERAGSIVGRQASEHIKPVVLELGGSDAFIVLDSADVEVAAGFAAACRMAIGGQTCISPKRLIVTEAVADRFIDALVPSIAGQVVGDPMDPATTLGPLSSLAAAELLQGQYQDAVDKGATVLLEGGWDGGPTAFFRPAVLADITPGMRLSTEEAFGPIVMVHRVNDADEAIRLANDCRYGLGGTVFGEDLDEADRVASALDTGMVGINTFIGGPTEIPFGGTKRSGVGRELGPTGMVPFSNVKTYARR